LYTITFLLVFTLLPIIYYEDKVTLNWLYSFQIFTFGVAGVSVQLGFTGLNYRLYRLCEGAFEKDEAIQATIDKVWNFETKTNETRLFNNLLPLDGRLHEGSDWIASHTAIADAVPDLDGGDSDTDRSWPPGSLLLPLLLLPDYLRLQCRLRELESPKGGCSW